MWMLKKKDRLTKPICIFCHHKVGTVLFTKVFRDFCKKSGLRFQELGGKQTDIPEGCDIALYSHSAIDPKTIKKPFLGVHLVRDPRDIIVSGYLYHKRANERWCTNEDFTISDSIMFPQVPYSQQHRGHEWKAAYIASLQEQSYQQTLNSLSQTDGITFEMNHYGAWTIGDISDWEFTHPNILEVKFEHLMNNFDSSFEQIFSHLALSSKQTKTAITLAKKHDLNRKSDSQIARMKHVSPGKPSKWREYFEPNHKALFKEKFGNILVELGYEKDMNW